MFGIFSTPREPEITVEQRAYFENQFHWLIENFGKGFLDKKMLIPDRENFPVMYDGSEEPAWKTLEIICRQLDLDAKEIHLDFYSEGAREINAGPQTFYLQGGKTEKFAGGLYWGRAEDGKFHIWINKGLLKNPQALVAILAHELAHAHLLGGHKLHAKYDHDHELVTEIFCVFSGFGIFNATQAFQINKGFDGWSYQYAGYLKQQSWGYLLALYALLREEEEEDPFWLKFLSPSLKKDFKTSMKWLTTTEAGSKFLSAKWKNNYNSTEMENSKLNGEWIKQCIYGPVYDQELAGQVLLSEIILNEKDGRLTGTAKDVDGKGMQNAEAIIEGTIRFDAIKFTLTYIFPDKITEDGVLVRRSEKESYPVSYNGYYSAFLDAFIGEWDIRKTDPEHGERSFGSGTWEMKRKEL